MDHPIESVTNVTLCEFHKVLQPHKVLQDSWDIYATLTEVLLYYHFYFFPILPDEPEKDENIESQKNVFVFQKYLYKGILVICNVSDQAS